LIALDRDRVQFLVAVLRREQPDADAHQQHCYRHNQKALANDPVLCWMPIETKGHSTKPTYAALTLAACTSAVSTGTALAWTAPTQAAPSWAGLSRRCAVNMSGPLSARARVQAERGRCGLGVSPRRRALNSAVWFQQRLFPEPQRCETATKPLLITARR
jgi:hypothetical protein